MLVKLLNTILTLPPSPTGASSTSSTTSNSSASGWSVRRPHTSALRSSGIWSPLTGRCAPGGGVDGSAPAPVFAFVGPTSRGPWVACGKNRVWRVPMSRLQRDLQGLNSSVKPTRRRSWTATLSRLSCLFARFVVPPSPLPTAIRFPPANGGCTISFTPNCPPDDAPSGERP